MLDKAALDIWGQAERVELVSQDDEMFLGDFSLLNLLLNCIDQDNYLPSKKVVLIEALCIILYDCLTSYDSEIDTEKIEAQKDLTIVLEECVKRKDKIAAVGKELPGYLRDLVFPKIGLK